jgi:hypothetical protein
MNGDSTTTMLMNQFPLHSMPAADANQPDWGVKFTLHIIIMHGSCRG